MVMVTVTHPGAGTGTGKVLTDGAALALRGHDLLAVGQGLTLHLIAQRYTVVAHTYSTRFWLPDVVVRVDLSVH